MYAHRKSQFLADSYLCSLRVVARYKLKDGALKSFIPTQRAQAQELVRLTAIRESCATDRNVANRRTLGQGVGPRRARGRAGDLV